MTQSEIEKAASEFATECLDVCDSKTWVEMSGTDYFVTIRNTFISGAEHARATVAAFDFDTAVKINKLEEENYFLKRDVEIAKPRWIKCSDRLPDVQDIYPVVLNGNKRAFAFFRVADSVWVDQGSSVTHWGPAMYLPAPEAESK